MDRPMVRHFFPARPPIDEARTEEIVSRMRQELQQGDFHAMADVEQGTDAWRESRKHRITATRVGSIVGVGYDDAVTMLRKWNMPLPSYALKFCQYGQLHERDADAAFMAVRKAFPAVYPPGVVSYPGLVVHSNGYFAGSPDGLVTHEDGSKSVLEYKAPARKSIKDMTVRELEVRHHIYDVCGAIGMACPHSYFAQCQWNMWLNSACRAYFVTWIAANEPAVRDLGKGCYATPIGSVQVVEIPYDAGWVERAREKCELFFPKLLRHLALLEQGVLEPGEVEDEPVKTAGPVKTAAPAPPAQSSLFK